MKRNLRRSNFEFYHEDLKGVEASVCVGGDPWSTNKNRNDSEYLNSHEVNSEIILYTASLFSVPHFPLLHLPTVLCLCTINSLHIHLLLL